MGLLSEGEVKECERPARELLGGVQPSREAPGTGSKAQGTRYAVDGPRPGTTGREACLGVAYTSRQNGWRGGEEKERCLPPTERLVAYWTDHECGFGVATHAPRTSPDEKRGRNVRLSNRYPRVLARDEGNVQGCVLAVQISGTGLSCLGERSMGICG